MAALAVCAIVSVSSCNKPDNTGETDDPTNETIPEGAVDMGEGFTYYWAKCNLGAEKPEYYSNYYSWGEIATKQNYDKASYKWWSSTDGYVSAITISKYNTDPYYGTVDNNEDLDDEDDAANVLLGKKWHTPSYGAWKELIDNCTWTWKTIKDVPGYGVVAGYEIVSNSNGNSIFLPAAGWCSPGLGSAWAYGSYWSSTLDTFGENKTAPVNAKVIWFYDAQKGTKTPGARWEGHTIRPVCSK